MTELAFPPTRAEALRRLHAINAARYAQTRNQLDGAVTRLSPYFTHGLLSVPEAIAHLLARGLHLQHKLIFELAWREYWQHVWRHLGDGIFESQRAPVSVLPYAAQLPVDVLEARSGVPAIDQSVRALYEHGYVHNHARMWLASYLVHLRKVDWRVAAAWFYGHLLDGDLASNALSWQWVAGTFSSKPYLFNNDNVARFAPTLAKAGTAIDRTYEALDHIARQQADVGAEPQAAALPTEPPPPLLQAPPVTADALPPLAGKRIALVHPWMLAGRPPQAEVVIGVLHLPFHHAHPWSALRWRFVLDAMRPCIDALWIGALPALAPLLQNATQVSSVATLSPGYADGLRSLCTALAPAPRYFPDPDPVKPSFSAFWNACTRGRGSIAPA